MADDSGRHDTDSLHDILGPELSAELGVDGKPKASSETAPPAAGPGTGGGTDAPAQPPAAPQAPASGAPAAPGAPQAPASGAPAAPSAPQAPPAPQGPIGGGAPAAPAPSPGGGAPLPGGAGSTSSGAAPLPGFGGAGPIPTGPRGGAPLPGGAGSGPIPVGSSPMPDTPASAGVDTLSESPTDEPFAEAPATEGASFGSAEEAEPAEVEPVEAEPMEAEPVELEALGAEAMGGDGDLQDAGLAPSQGGEPASAGGWPDEAAPNFAAAPTPEYDDDEADESTYVGPPLEEEFPAVADAPVRTTPKNTLRNVAEQLRELPKPITLGAGTVLVLLLVLPWVFGGSSEPPTAYLITDATMYAGPGGEESFAVAADLEHNEELRVLDRTETMALVRDPIGRAGWVDKNLLAESPPDMGPEQTFARCYQRPNETSDEPCLLRAAQQRDACLARCDELDTGEGCATSCEESFASCTEACENEVEDTLPEQPSTTAAVAAAVEEAKAEAEAEAEAELEAKLEAAAEEAKADRAPPPRTKRKAKRRRRRRRRRR